MSNYVQPDDLKLYFPESRLIELSADLSTQTDWDDPTIQANVGAAVESAEAEVDALLSPRFPVPIVPAPARLKLAAAFLAIWYLFARKVEISDAWEKRRKDQVDWLERVSESELGLVVSGVASNDDIAGEGAGLVMGGGGLDLFG